MPPMRMPALGNAADRANPWRPNPEAATMPLLRKEGDDGGNGHQEGEAAGGFRKRLIELKT